MGPLADARPVSQGVTLGYDLFTVRWHVRSLDVLDRSKLAQKPSDALGAGGGDDRNGNNLSYDRVNWLIYLTEQHKAFSRQVRLPRYMTEQSITLPALVAEKLRSLDEATLAGALGEYLNSRQIQAILGRRDLILNHWPESE